MSDFWVYVTALAIFGGVLWVISGWFQGKPKNRR